MQIRRTRNFELRLGKIGVIFFTFSISFLLLIAFVLGVMVGKNIETYPERITSAIPGLIRDKIASTPVNPGVVVKPEDAQDVARDGREDARLTFYNTLAGKSGEVKETIPQTPPDEKPTVREKPAMQDQPRSKENFVVQVASLKDEEKARALQKRLSDMGYQPALDSKDLKEGEKMHRVKLSGFETKEEAEKAADDVNRKLKIKCLVTGAR